MMNGHETTIGHDAPRCYGCAAPVEDAPGVYYCDKCVARQTREHGAELEAFDAYHGYADMVARRTR
jgi:hypothetical protein